MIDRKWFRRAKEKRVRKEDSVGRMLMVLSYNLWESEFLLSTMMLRKKSFLKNYLLRIFSLRHL